jgi:type IV secretion system protein VirB11
MTKVEAENERHERQMENLLGDLAPLVPFFDTKTVMNIYVYGSGMVQVDDSAAGTYETGIVLTAPERMRIINSLASVAGAPIDLWNYPALESIVPKYRIRTTAILPPWTEAPELTFRRPPDKIYTLEEYRDAGRMTAALYEKIVKAIENRANIVISGSTGSGKTTFTNACIEKMREFTPDDRFYIVEDTPELQCRSKYVTQLDIRKEQSILAIQTSLRWMPKRIIFGELRSGDVAVELLEAWNTGHPGNVTTIHADSAASTIPRIEGLLRQKITGTLPELEGVIDLIVHLRYKRNFGPQIDEALTVSEILGKRRGRKKAG